VAMSDLANSDVIGPWHPPVVLVHSPIEHEQCDCGFSGEWEYRSVFTWHNVPGYRRPDWAIRADLTRGFPVRSKDGGWWIIAGWDERCPQCGDVERFDERGAVVARFAEQAKTVTLPARVGRTERDPQ